MAKLKGITIELGSTDKSVMKLRAIAKHAEKLADELAAIDNAWQCECGSFKYEDSYLYAGNDEEEPYSSSRQCRECGEYYAIPNEPTHEGESNEFL